MSQLFETKTRNPDCKIIQFIKWCRFSGSSTIYILFDSLGGNHDIVALDMNFVDVEDLMGCLVITGQRKLDNKIGLFTVRQVLEGMNY